MSAWLRTFCKSRPIDVREAVRVFARLRVGREGCSGLTRARAASTWSTVGRLYWGVRPVSSTGGAVRHLTDLEPGHGVLGHGHLEQTCAQGILRPLYRIEKQCRRSRSLGAPDGDDDLICFDGAQDFQQLHLQRFFGALQAVNILGNRLSGCPLCMSKRHARPTAKKRLAVSVPFLDCIRSYIASVALASLPMLFIAPERCWRWASGHLRCMQSATAQDHTCSKPELNSRGNDLDRLCFSIGFCPFDFAQRLTGVSESIFCSTSLGPELAPRRPACYVAGREH